MCLPNPRGRKSLPTTLSQSDIPSPSWSSRTVQVLWIFVNQTYQTFDRCHVSSNESKNSSPTLGSSWLVPTKSGKRLSHGGFEMSREFLRVLEAVKQSLNPDLIHSQKLHRRYPSAATANPELSHGGSRAHHPETLPQVPRAHLWQIWSSSTTDFITSYGLIITPIYPLLIFLNS